MVYKSLEMGSDWLASSIFFPLWWFQVCVGTVEIIERNWAEKSKTVHQADGISHSGDRGSHSWRWPQGWDKDFSLKAGGWACYLEGHFEPGILWKHSLVCVHMSIGRHFIILVSSLTTINKGLEWRQPSA